MVIAAKGEGVGIAFDVGCDDAICFEGDAVKLLVVGTESEVTGGEVVGIPFHVGCDDVICVEVGALKMLVVGTEDEVVGDLICLEGNAVKLLVVGILVLGLVDGTIEKSSRERDLSISKDSMIVLVSPTLS